MKRPKPTVMWSHFTACSNVVSAVMLASPSTNGGDATLLAICCSIGTNQWRQTSLRPTPVRVSVDPKTIAPTSAKCSSACRFVRSRVVCPWWMTSDGIMYVIPGT